jgi:hypothetical protein
MNFSWPQRAAGKSARRSAARIGLVGIAAVTVAGTAALTAPAISAMAATGTNPTTTVVTNPLFPITEPVDTPATVNFEVTDNVAGGPAPTGTVNITTAAPWADNAGLPAGTVYQCTADLTPAAGVNGDGLAYSTGSCATGGVGWGFIELGATYSGDANNATSDTDGTEIKIVNLYPTTTTVTAPTGTAGKAVTLAATLGGPAKTDPGNVLAASPEIESAVPPNPDTINFTITNAADDVVATCPYVPLAGGTTAPANYADCTVPATLAAGKYNVTAVFAGDEYAAGATATGTLTVNAPKSSTTTKMSGVSGYVGGKTTLAAKVTGGSTPTGTVKFVWGGKTLCSASLSKGAAHCTHVFTGVGSLKVQAVYEGDSTHNTSSSAVATVKVTKQPTSVKVSASKATTGKAVKLTATVKALSAATGTVTFYVNGHKVGTAKVSGGKASWSYTWHATGTYKVTAVYGGNSTHLGSKGAVSVKVG